MPSEWLIDWPTLGDLVTAWVERHCVVPDKHLRGRPFVYSPWQFWGCANHYRIRPDASFDPDRPPLAAAFWNRRSQIMMSQKTGKGPWAATIVAAEGAGPTQFAGWAGKDDGYACVDHGCPCGWSYPYLPGEPMGGRHPSPLIQILANSEDQVENTFGPLRTMVKIGPLGELMAPRESFIRIFGSTGDEDLDRIEAVTSSAQSRLGNPISFALQDETGLYTASNKMILTAETQRRGAAGMGGRTMETTNCFDPSQNSTAQRTFESKVTDVFKLYDPPPAHLSYKNKRERRQIHRYNYRHSPWVNIDDIEAEAAEIAEQDPAQAERFYGNRIVAASDAYFDDAAWEALADPHDVPEGSAICLGFDGSQYDDWTAIRARWMDAGDGRMYGFTPTFSDGVPTWWDPTDFDGEVPRAEVQAAIAELFKRYTVIRLYCDPELWQSEIDEWALKYGSRVVQWPTYRTKQMSEALKRFKVDISTKALTHDGDETMLRHLRNARRIRRPGGVIIGKPTNHQKIDLVMADTLAHEAACDAKAAGWKPKKPRRRPRRLR